MDESERVATNQALTLISARAARMASYLYTFLVTTAEGSPRTRKAREAATETIEMLEALFVRTSGKYSEPVEMMLPAKRDWLKRFEERWNSQNPSFQVLECLQVLESYQSLKDLSEEQVSEAAKLLLTLQTAANEELAKYSDPILRSFRPSKRPDNS